MIKPVESIPVTVTIEHGDQVHRFTAKSATLNTIFGHMYINMEYPVVSKDARAIERDTAQAVNAEREAIMEMLSWFHPHDVFANPQAQEDVLESIRSGEHLKEKS